MDLCGPMRVESFNGKRYVLVIVDDYSRYTWTHFLRPKDEPPEVLIDFLKLVQRGLHAHKGLNTKRQTASEPTDQYGRPCRKTEHSTFVKTARTMPSVTKVPLFFWAEAIATTCFTQNHSLIIPRHEKTPTTSSYEPRKPLLLRVFYTKSRAYKVYKKGTRVISETIMVNCAEMLIMASDTSVLTTFLNVRHRNLNKQCIIGNPSQSIRTRRQLETDGEMCMFALTMSRTESKNIKEVMADFAWIEVMQEELHQFDRLDVWQLVDRPLCRKCH
ncbi:retrovirus-related pol polyprotein from transposon TNT 1-94 [Tanacetum coccineum]